MLTDSMSTLNIGQSFLLYCQNFCNYCNPKDRLQKLLATFQIGNLEGYVLLTEYKKSIIPQKYIILMIPLCSYSWILIPILLGGPLYLVKNVLLFIFMGMTRYFVNVQSNSEKE